MEEVLVVQHAIATGVVLLFLLGLAVLWEFWKVDRLNERKEKAMAERMRTEAELWNISPSQVRLLETFVPYVGSKHAMGIFTSPRLFETMSEMFAPALPRREDIFEITFGTFLWATRIRMGFMAAPKVMFG